MTEKVKLTQEQADAMDYALEKHNRTLLVKTYVNQFKREADSRFVDKLEILYKLTYDEFFKSIYIGYEVESEFEVGDWVVNALGNIGHIKRIERRRLNKHIYHGLWFRERDVVKMDCVRSTFQRHATPEEIAEEKQRRWWAKNGRDVWELKKGDVLLDLEYRQGVFIHEDRKLSPPKQDYYRVLCFAEDRKDLEGDK